MTKLVYDHKTKEFRPRKTRKLKENPISADVNKYRREYLRNNPDKRKRYQLNFYRKLLKNTSAPEVSISEIYCVQNSKSFLDAK